MTPLPQRRRPDAPGRDASPARGQPSPSPSPRAAPLAALLLATALAPWQALQAAPAQVLLLRHGHKSGVPGDFNLSPQGFERAIALGELLPACFGKPSHILTFYLDPVSSKNARSYQSAVPLAVATRVNIQIDEGSREGSQQSGRRIRNDPRYRNGRVVLFWEHRRMPELAAGLGWPGMAPVADDGFDDLFEFTYPAGSSRPVVRRLSQSALLSGRQSCPHQAQHPAPPATPASP